MTKDMTILVYGVEVLVCVSTFGLFLWWAIYKWMKERIRPSNIYILVMLLFLSQGWAVFIALYSRCIRETEAWVHLKFLTTNIWHTRVIPRLVIESLILYRMSRRVYINFFKPRMEQRRRGDHDGEDV